MTPKISSAEWTVMSAIWADGPLTAKEVVAALPPENGWKLKTVNTFLTRLVEKGALTVDKSEKAYVYTARIPREQCVQAESASFLRRVFQGETANLVLHFCRQADLSAEEIKELEQALESASKTRKPRK